MIYSVTMPRCLSAIRGIKRRAWNKSVLLLKNDVAQLATLGWQTSLDVTQKLLSGHTWSAD